MTESFFLGSAYALPRGGAIRNKGGFIVLA